MSHRGHTYGGMSAPRIRRVLRIFREFVMEGATQWQMGCNRHVVWELVAETLGDDNRTRKSPAEHQFIWPTNRKEVSTLELSDWLRVTPDKPALGEEVIVAYPIFKRDSKTMEVESYTPIHAWRDGLGWDSACAWRLHSDPVHYIPIPAMPPLNEWTDEWHRSNKIPPSKP